MKEIKLHNGMLAIVDDEDYEYCNQFKWYAVKSRNTFYAGRAPLDGNKKLILMHREILGVHGNLQVDHRNYNSLDNRKENMRVCTPQQNNQNQRCSKRNKFGAKGVTWCKISKKFRARIATGEKRIHLGCFNVLGDADSAYRIAEEKYFGEFSRGYNKPLLSVCG